MKRIESGYDLLIFISFFVILLESVRSTREVMLGLSFCKNVPLIRSSNHSKSECWVGSYRMTKVEYTVEPPP